MKSIVQQIQGRRIAKRKFPSLLEYDEYHYPAKESLEQASSEITAKFKSNLIKGESFVDLTGGMGIDSYLLGRNFKECTYVEPNTALYNQTSHNFKTLGFAHCATINSTCETFLCSNTKKYDWAYIDPSRRISGERKISINNYEPNVVELAPQIFDAADNILVKLSPMQDISECLKVLDNIQKIWVISINNEVKELLLHLNQETNPSPIISAIDLKNKSLSTFSYVFEDRMCTVEFDKPRSYLYQPGAAVIKAELHNRYAQNIRLTKLHPNTQLFCSDSFLDDFFGKVFHVKEYFNLNKKEIQRVLPKMKANIITKNFPLSPSDIIKKYKIKEGGQDFLIAFTDIDEEKRVAICSKITQ
jgi:hypothetical protein